LLVHLVEPETDQGRALHLVTTDRRADLLDNNGLLLSHDLSPDLSYQASTAVSPRRACSSETLRPRREATERGLSTRLSASKVARTMLYGLAVPCDLATMSLMPSVSNTARIGPPAMMPVPGTAARRMTLPAPWRPCTSWCSVRASRSGTRIMVRFAASVALRIASGTSRALP